MASDRTLVAPSRLEDCYALAATMRRSDAMECLDLGMTPKQAIRECYRGGVLRKTYFVDGEIAAMSGLNGNLLSDVGHPYLLTAAPIERVPVWFMKTYRAAVAEMLAMRPILVLQVAESYTKSIRMLELAGFSIGEPKRIGRGSFCEARIERPRHGI